MKAGVLHALGQRPRYEDIAAPEPQPHEVLMTVKASCIKQLDRLKASGRHYTTYPHMPVVVGTDATGVLADGTRVYAMSGYGLLAQQAVIPQHSYTILPANINFATAAALPNALIGSDAALMCRAGMKPGNVVLVSGATGVTGKIAIQAAKLRGASHVIAMGRNETTLQALRSLGADEVISLQQPDDIVIARLCEIQTATPIDIVLDYLWGHPAELIFTAFKGTPPRKVKMVVIGEMAGANISLPSAVLRSTQIEVLGSGIGSISKTQLDDYLKNELPAMLQLAGEGNLQADIETFDLSEIETVWNRDDKAGKRLVITM